MHLPLASLILHAALTWLVGSGFVILAIPLLGFPAGIRALLQRLGWATHSVGDDSLQIIIDFALGLAGLLIIASVVWWFGLRLRRLLHRDLRLLRMIARLGRGHPAAATATDVRVNPPDG